MLGRVGVGGVELRALRREAPGLQHREPVADVAQRDHEVVVLALALHRGHAALDAHHPPLAEANHLRRIGQREGASTGRRPSSSARSASAVERSAIRVERCPKRTDENVASASTSVPAAVASEAIVGQSTARQSFIELQATPRRARSTPAARRAALESASVEVPCLLGPSQGPSQRRAMQRKFA